MERLMFGWDFEVDPCRDSEDKIWSRFLFELLIWTQPSGPLCLWQCLLLFSACLAFKQIKAGTLSSLLLLNSKTILFSFFNLQSNNWHWIMQWNIIISLYTLWTLWDWRNIFTCFVILVCIRQISRLLLLSSNYFISYLKCFFWPLKT